MRWVVIFEWPAGTRSATVMRRKVMIPNAIGNATKCADSGGRLKDGTTGSTMPANCTSPYHPRLRPARVISSWQAGRQIGIQLLQYMIGNLSKPTALRCQRLDFTLWDFYTCKFRRHEKSIGGDQSDDKNDIPVKDEAPGNCGKKSVVTITTRTFYRMHQNREIMFRPHRRNRHLP